MKHAFNPKKLGQILVGLSGKTLTSVEIKRLKHPLVAGVILFSRNFENRQQLQALNQSILEINPNALITVDHEGGRVQRFIKEFSKLPDMRSIGALFHQNQSLAQNKAYSLGKLMAIELNSTGVDFSFAPVCDLDYNRNSAIGNRAFDANPDIVSQLVCALHQGLKDSGSIGVAKHFPGHGYVKSDSHIALPIDERSMTELEKTDIIPFKALISQNIEAIMPAHIIYPDFDAENTALSSPKWMNYLKENLKFSGIIISDDLDMQGALNMGDALNRALSCFENGVDLLLCCNQTETIEQILQAFPLENHPNQALLLKLSALKAKNAYQFNYHENLDWQKAHHILFDNSFEK